MTNSAPTTNFYKGSASKTYKGPASNTFKSPASNFYKDSSSTFYNGQPSNTFKGPAPNSYKGSSSNFYNGPASNTFKGTASNSYKGSSSNFYNGPPPTPSRAQPLIPTRVHLPISTMSASNTFKGTASNSYKGSSSNFYNGPASNTFKGPASNSYKGPASNFYNGSSSKFHNGPASNTFKGPASNSYKGPASNFYNSSSPNFHNGPASNTFKGPASNSYKGLAHNIESPAQNTFKALGPSNYNGHYNTYTVPAHSRYRRPASNTRRGPANRFGPKKYMRQNVAQAVCTKSNEAVAVEKPGNQFAAETNTETAIKMKNIENFRTSSLGNSCWCRLFIGSRPSQTSYTIANQKKVECHSNIPTWEETQHLLAVRQQSETDGLMKYLQRPEETFSRNTAQLSVCVTPQLFFSPRSVSGNIGRRRIYNLGDRSAPCCGRCVQSGEHATGFRIIRNHVSVDLNASEAPAALTAQSYDSGVF
ncbi:hypothetical protein JOB18_003889 [Solea senegalensis]|uniref:Uncharacterized protein n=1 Tax=Solea senegalensis TaxID=28829 RepID=A0AAV6Q144_SOLSE|nr:hypothetical protein JOB18_003889 [Solea senegalensis]